MNILPNYQSGPDYKTAFTSAACLGAGLAQESLGMMQSGVFGFIAKGVSVLIKPHLYKHNRAQIVNDLFADILGGAAAYGAFFAAAKLGIIATPITMTALLTLTAVSVAVSIVTIKTVYIALTTFFFCSIKDNGMLEELADIFLQPLRMLGATHFLEGWKGIKVDDYKFKNESEKLTLFSQILVGLEWASIFAIFVSLFAALMAGSLLPPLQIMIAWAIVGTGFMFLAALTAFPILAAALKLTSWALYPTTFKNFRNVVQWQFDETEKSSNPSRFSDPFIHRIVKNQNADLNQNNLLFTLPADTLGEIASRFDDKDLYSLFSTCKGMLAFSEKYFKTNQKARAQIIEGHFPKDLIELLGGVEKFLKFPCTKIKAHRITKPIPRNIQDTIQSTYSLVRENGTHPPLNVQMASADEISHSLSRRISCFNPQDMGPATIAWGIDPISFVALRAIYSIDDNRFLVGTIRKLFKRFGLAKTDKRETETVVLFHRRAKMNSETWGISCPMHPNFPLNLDYGLLQPQPNADRPNMDWFKKLLEGQTMQKVDDDSYSLGGEITLKA